ncbi:MAG: ATP synthase F1 subunit gamma [Armatimonadetes bacterium]|nr:ATP synthase F1 subunit gamma [Armatimonadota bacterium]MBS1701862.1 ATP synthase F1 subunit gamma [Armatimonadota bacterium]
MATLKQIRQRIRAAKNIQQITKAMKLVAAARLKKATDRVLEARPYADKLKDIMTSMSASGSLPAHPLLTKRDVNNVLVLVLTSDRGLAGAFNTSILRKATDFFKSLNGKPLHLLTYGKKANQFFGKRGYSIVDSYSAPSAGADLSDAVAITRKAREMFETGQVDAVYVVYSKFISAIRQIPQVVQLLPIEAPDTSEGALGGEVEFEPSADVVLNTLLPRYFQTLVWQAMLESTASEFGARMSAMTAATDNAGKMIHTLTLKANRERQAAITKEILEVVGGAEALG